MATNPVFSLGKYRRLFIAQTTGDTDSDFVLVDSENDVELSWKSDKDSISTKSYNKITLPEGDETWQIKVTCDEIAGDIGFLAMLGLRNASAPIQIRDTKNGKVIFEGSFTAADISSKGQEKGAVQYSFTLDNSGPVTWNTTNGGRAISSS